MPARISGFQQHVDYTAKMSGGGAGPLVPTFHGFVHNSMDGLILFEACLSGKLHHVPRRPHDRERSTLIKSGSIFIYEENASGIKRWTDGVAWSPSRILGNFLIYRELEKPFPPGEKKRAMKRKRESMPGDPYPRAESDEMEPVEQVTPISPPSPNIPAEAKATDGLVNDQDKELERSLIGSLVDSYGFRPDGLVKKTMSISINGISHHMVSYYKVDDVKNNVLPRPLTDPRLQNITVRPELYLKQNFRAPVEENEHYAIDGQMHAHPQMMYQSMQPSPYGVRPGQYFAGQQYPQMYGMPGPAGSPYGGGPPASWPQQQPGTAAATYGNPPGYAPQGYGPYYNNNRTPSQSNNAVGKTEDQTASAQQQMPYGGQYPPTYPNMQRNGSQSTPTMVQGGYSTTPQQQQAATFGQMGGRAGYNGGGVASPTNNGPPQQQPYGNAPPQGYGVRSPTQHYGMQGTPGSGVAQSPQTGVKSPNPSAQAGAPAAPMASSDGSMQYRNETYGPTPQPGSASGDVSGLGISNSPSYPAPPQHGQSYSGYGASSVATGPSGGQYGQ